MFTEDEVIDLLKCAGFNLEEKFTDYFAIRGFGVEGYLIKNIYKHRTTDECLFADGLGNWDKFGNSNLCLTLPNSDLQLEKLIAMLKELGENENLEFNKY